MHPLTERIIEVQRRLVLRERAAAACRVAAAVIAMAMLLGAADYVVRSSDPGLRLLASGALVAAAAWAVYRWWYLPHRRLSRLTVARLVESHFPQLRDSLASAVEFLQQEEDDHTAGSAQLRRLVVAEADMAITGLPLDEVIDRRPLRRAAMWFAAAAMAAALCLAVDAQSVGIAVARLAAPFGATEWPRQHHLAFRNAPQRLTAGQTFEVELFDAGGRLPDEVRIEYRTEHEGRRQLLSEAMLRSGDVMIARRENVRQPFAFRARGGDDDTMRWHEVEVVEPPQVESLSITVHPPAYSGLPPTAAERHMKVLEGSGIEVRGTANKSLGAARILMEAAEPIAATIQADDSGSESRAFHIGPNQWIATKSGAYQLELTDDGGMAGIVGQWNLRVEPDPPPSISWQRPSDDLYVVPTALVPIELLVKDSLAVERVELLYKRSEPAEVARERQPTESRMELYRGAKKPMVASGSANGARGESRVVEFKWDLAPLHLPVGAQMSLTAEAADYRPGIGRTVAPRRVTTISAEVLQTRLGDKQAQIIRQLERAAGLERMTREEIRRLEIQQRETGQLSGDNHNAVRSAELNQRRLTRMLTNRSDGVPALINALVAEVEMNRLAGSTIIETMERLTAELARLASGPLSVAERELTAAQKTLEKSTEADRQQLSHSLASLGTAQDDVVVTLERLVNELSGKSDYQRFVRLIAELREDQLTHGRTARIEISLETLPLRPEELTRPQRVKLNQTAAGQQALAARFDKIDSGMDRLAKELAERKEEAAELVAEAISLARRLAIGTEMRQAAADLSENRVGKALTDETRIADHLQQVLNVLRRENRQPAELVNSLRVAEERLKAIQKQLSALRDQIAQAERNAPANDDRRLSELNEEQRRLRDEIEKLAGQLERLQATDAGKSTRSAGKRLENRADQKRLAAGNQIAQAEKDLEQAARQLAQRRQQAEEDFVLELVRRFQAELTEMVQRQQRLIESTVHVDRERASDKPLDAKTAATVSELAAEERGLAQLSKEHAETLFGLGAVRVSLEEAQRRLIAAAELLEKRDTGPATQQAEQRALERLKGMLDAFAQTAAEAGQKPQGQPPPAAGAGPPGDQPQRRPTFELLEVKMLRMLQTELNDRTREHEQRLATLAKSPADAQRVELEREARELAAEQGRLAELVQTMLTRENKKAE